MLTDNEKVAEYFLGWHPNCPAHRGTERCSKAPDVTWPHNVIKIMEELMIKGYEVDFGYVFDHYECCIEYRYQDNTVDLDDWSGEDQTIGNAFLQALMSLYNHIQKVKDE